MSHKYKVGDVLILNTKKEDLKRRNGERIQIEDLLPEQYVHDYDVIFESGGQTRVKEIEIQEINDNLLATLQIGQKVIYESINITVEVSQIDYQHRQVSIEFPDGGSQVVGIEKLRMIEKESDSLGDKIGYFGEKGLELGNLVDLKQESYGDSVTKASKLIKIYLEDYRNEEGKYILSEELIDHILLQVRIIDKQNRIFSNPKADKMGESPYKDISGYGLLGERLQSGVNN